MAFIEVSLFNSIAYPSLTNFTHIMIFEKAQSYQENIF